MKNIFKKIIKSSASRLIFLLIGLSFAAAIIVVQSAWDTVVVSGTSVLSAADYNALINEVKVLQVKVASIVPPTIPCGDVNKIFNVAANGAILCQDTAIYSMPGHWMFNNVDSIKATNITLSASGSHCGTGTTNWRCQAHGHENIYLSICQVTFLYAGIPYNSLTQCATNVDGNGAYHRGWN